MNRFFMFKDNLTLFFYFMQKIKIVSSLQKTMKKAIQLSFLLFIFFQLNMNCQPSATVQPIKTSDRFIMEVLTTTSLSTDFKECSGVELSANGHLWVHNDKGNKANIYQLNGQGIQTGVIAIQSFENNDWEDLAYDESDNLYIGDFGNNANDRTNLSILKISNPDNVTTGQCTPEVIYFSFEDQTVFPPEKPEKFFDTEGFFAHNEKLYLFIKDRSKPFRGITKLYELPNIPGTYTAKLISSFNTSEKKSEGAITGADISPDGTIVALLSKNILWLFTDFTSPHFLDGKVHQIVIPYERKFEGVVFKDNCTIYLTSEETKYADPQLQCYNICK